MALDLNRFANVRPYLYHLTSRRNIVHIKRDMFLKSANTLIAESGETGLFRTVRRGHKALAIGDRQVELRDQDPLRAGNIFFSNGWALADLVSHLNDRVFFWPGWDYGPIDSGKNHYARYARENPVILRVSTRKLLAANPGAEALFCHYNSGAPRCICKTRKGSPRGPDTFLPACSFEFGLSGVREVTFKSQVSLPDSTEASPSPFGPWKFLENLRYE